MGDYVLPTVTVDVVLFCYQRSRIRVLLIQRRNNPFKGMWALPGGYVEENELLENAAQRELREETGLQIPHLSPIDTFDEPGRDPRGWCISKAFWAIAAKQENPKAGSDAKNTKWFSLNKLPKLAFDHEKIIARAVQLLKIYAKVSRPLLNGALYFPTFLHLFAKKSHYVLRIYYCRGEYGK